MNYIPKSRYWKDDRELFQIARQELYSAVVGDILDELGYIDQFLSPDIKPIRVDMFLIGRAMPVLELDYTEEETQNIVAGELPGSSALMLRALDELQEFDIYVCSGSSTNYALWGELMTTRAHSLKSSGVVLDGYTRDIKSTIDGPFPIFSRGSYARDQSIRGRVVDVRVDTIIGNTPIEVGSIMIGDLDGVCVVPREVEQEVFSRSIEKSRAEKTVKMDLENGMTATDAFAKYGLF